MKDLTFEEFIGLGSVEGIHKLTQNLHEAAKGNEIYRVDLGNSRSFVVMGADEYNIYHDALCLLLQNPTLLPEELLKRFNPKSDE